MRAWSACLPVLSVRRSILTYFSLPSVPRPSNVLYSVTANTLSLTGPVSVVTLTEYQSYGPEGNRTAQAAVGETAQTRNRDNAIRLYRAISRHPAIPPC